MKKFFLFLFIFILNGCAVTRVGEILPGKMYSVDSDKVMDFGIELVLATTGGGDVYAKDNDENISYTGFYSYNRFKDSEGYNTRGNLFGDGRNYTIHLIINPSLTTPTGSGVAKENGEIKYRIEFPVYD